MADEQAEKAPAEAGAGEAAAAKPKSSMMLIIIIGVAIMVITPVITYFVVKATVPSTPAPEARPSPTEQATFDLGEIYVNIAETKGTRILKIQPVLVLSETRLANQLEKINPLLKDRVLQAASTKTIDELEGPNGREALKREIMTLINEATKDKLSGAVTDVYFSQFLIQ
jgi:flagellar basal body-associated protein FliL